MSSSTGEQFTAWQACPHVSSILCALVPDHPPLQWDERGFIYCVVEECGYSRRDIHPAVLTAQHNKNHRGCKYEGMQWFQ